MKSYLNAKLILLREILEKNSTIISDRKIEPFYLIKKISRDRNLKLLEISKEFQKIKSKIFIPMSDFKIKN